MNNSNFKNYKIKFYSFSLIIAGHQLQAQNEFATSAINLQMLIPVGCVIGFAFFMFHAFLKQKDN